MSFLRNVAGDHPFLIADLKKSVVIHQTSLSYDDETLLMGASQAKVFMVADGVGGGSSGDRASLMAIRLTHDQTLVNAGVMDEGDQHFSASKCVVS